MKENDSKIIVQRVYDKMNGKNQAVGVFVGMAEGETVKTGWSRVSLYLGDKFDIEVGKAFAFRNMILAKKIPIFTNEQKEYNFRNQYANFQKRCLKYFKQCNSIKTPKHNDI